MKIKTVTYCLIFLGLTLFTLPKVIAQNINSVDQNVSDIKSSQISDAQMRVIMQRAIESGWTPDQIESLARSRGMDEKEIERFKERAERLYDNKSMQEGTNGRRINTRQDVDFPESLDNRLVYNKMPEKELNFGFSLFRNTDLTFEPSFNISTPKDYLIGPGDLLNIDIWGASQHSYQEVVSNEGSILISNVGPVFLSGLSTDEADKKLKTILSRIYSGLNDGNTFMKVTLGAVRSIQINIVGEVILPGTYNISALATAFNAMYVAGGPAENGSLRDIQIIRDNKVIAHIDFYEYLIQARQSNNIRLQDQDIIFVPSYSNRVSIKGEVKREMRFDIKLSESLEDLIDYAGGFTGNAYTERVKIFRKTSKENRVLDIAATYLDAIKLQNGDEIQIDSVFEYILT
jgi:protein involved in polysaccharide export with SLBB domain